jgi:hypothetical protein
MAMTTEIMPLDGAMRALKASFAEQWAFPDIDQWSQEFESLDEALPLVAALVGSGRYLWWVTGDVAESLMRKFGRNEAVKRSLGAVFGCKARTVEYRARAAVVFPPDKRYPDVPIELYREALMWGDGQAVELLEAALEDGRGWHDLRMERYENDGRDAAEPIFQNRKGKLSWFQSRGYTEYVISITEEGGPRFKDNDFDVVITVAPKVQKENERESSKQEWIASVAG